MTLHQLSHEAVLIFEAVEEGRGFLKGRRAVWADPFLTKGQLL